MHIAVVQRTAVKCGSLSYKVNPSRIFVLPSSPFLVPIPSPLQKYVDDQEATVTET